MFDCIRRGDGRRENGLKILSDKIEKIESNSLKICVISRNATFMYSVNTKSNIRDTK